MSPIPTNAIGIFTEDFGPKVVSPAGDVILAATDWTNSTGARLVGGAVATFGTGNGVGGDPGILVQTAQLVPVLELDDEEPVFLRNLGMSVDHFYALANITGYFPTLPPFTWRMKKISAAGAVLINIVGNADLPVDTDLAYPLGVAASPDNTILYWAGAENDGSTGGSIIRRFDLANLVALSNLVTLAGHYVIELLCLPNGHLIAVWLDAGLFTNLVRRYDAAGAQQNNYTVGMGEGVQGICLNEDQDSASFWMYIDATFMREIDVATGATLQEVTLSV